MKNLLLLLLLFFSVEYINGQDIHFCYSTELDADSQGATITASLTHEGASSENIVGYTLRMYFDNSSTTYETGSEDFTLSDNNLGWSTAGLTSTSVQTGVSNSDIPAVYNSFVEFQVNDGSFTGTDLNSGDEFDIMTFEVSFPDGTTPDIYLVATDEDPGIQYIGADFGQHDITLTAICNSEQPLPAELISFSAKAQDSDAYLNWITASENNVSHFDLERSFDGKEWSKINRKEAKGSSNVETHYENIDRNIREYSDSEFIAYYRLKINDMDATFEYSAIKSIKFNGDQTEISIYPNPVRGQLIISNVQPQSEIVLVNSLGEVVLKYEASGEEDSLNVENISSGIYTIIISSKSAGLKTERVVVIE